MHHIQKPQHHDEQSKHLIEEYSELITKNEVTTASSINTRSMGDCYKIIVFIILLFFAIIIQLYANQRVNVLEKHREDYQKIREESDLLLIDFFVKYQQRLDANQKDRIIYEKLEISKQWQSKKLKYLEENHCPQLINYFSYSTTSETTITTSNFDNQQSLKSQNNEVQGSISDDKLKKEEQKKDKQQKIHTKDQQQQQKDSKRQLIRPIGGITSQKIELANKLKLLNFKSPWDQVEEEQQNIEYLRYEQQYKISHYKELPFCIVVPTFNNQQNSRYKKNLNSILLQNYTNFHITIINDGSTDKTGQLISQYISNLQQYKKLNNKSIINITLHNNQKQQKAMVNLRKAAFQYCQENQIFVIVDGDDQLIGRNVFKLFNSRFWENGSLFVYGNFLTAVGALGFSRPFKPEVIEKNKYRETNFVTSHLRAFYTKLFRMIKEEDLKDENGEYFQAANDIAICIPILEMSHFRVTYIPQITYLYNSNTGLNNHHIRMKQQTQNSKSIRKKQKYSQITDLMLSNKL